MMTATSRTSTPLSAALVVLGVWWGMGAAVAHAESDSIVTAGVSTRVALQNSGESASGGTDYTLHVGARVELLYVLGAEIEIAQIPPQMRGDIYRPSMRLTGHLHLFNSESFDLYLGAGTAARHGGDLLDIRGETTMYRLGGGMELVRGGHWAFGMDLYWNVAGIGFYEGKIEEKEAELSAAATPEEVEAALEERPGFDAGHYELGFAIRYFF